MSISNMRIYMLRFFSSFFLFLPIIIEIYKEKKHGNWTKKREANYFCIVWIWIIKQIKGVHVLKE